MTWEERQREYRQRAQPAVDEIVALMRADFPDAEVQYHWDNHGWLGFKVFVASAAEEQRARVRMEQLIAARNDFLSRDGTHFDATMGVSYDRTSPFTRTRRRT